MKKWKGFLLVAVCVLLLSACTEDDSIAKAIQQEVDERFTVGVILPDVGLGDQSFYDSAAQGLVRARDQLNILWSYRDLNTSASLEEGLEELLSEQHDIIMGVGYSSQEIIEKAAKEHPEQRFVLIDTTSEVANVDSIIFKEDEGSYLAGVVAALNSKTNTIGFVGGFEDPVILKFLDGFREGAQSINPSINVLVQYANTYSDDKVGASIASEMITQGADVLYAAAGYTGVGLLQQAQKEHVLAIGVDSDQYFYAEKAVVTSMMKNIDVAVYSYVENLMNNPKQGQLISEFGIAEDGVDLAPIRIIPNAIEVEEKVEQAKQQLSN